MAWNIRITDEAKKDFEKIQGSVRRQVLAGIIKVSGAPLPSPDIITEEEYHAVLYKYS